MADGSRFFFDAVGVFRFGINTQIQSLRIERISFKELLAEIIFRNAAVWRKAKVSREKNTEGHDRGRAMTELHRPHKSFSNRPDHRDLKINQHELDAVLALRLKDRHRNGEGDEQEDSRCSRWRTAPDLEDLRRANCEDQMKKRQPAKTPAKNAGGRDQAK